MTVDVGAADTFTGKELPNVGLAKTEVEGRDILGAADEPLRFKLDVDEPAGLENKMLIPGVVAPLTARTKGMIAAHSMARSRRGNEVSNNSCCSV